MAKPMKLERAQPLGDQNFGASGISVTPLSGGYRCSLRVAQSDISAVSNALGVDLPQQPKTSAHSANRVAMWLGPDEWLIYDSKANPIDDLKNINALCSAVDVSHRNTAIEAKGPLAAEVINAGCPQDLSLEIFPVGACSRTILGKAEIVLYRAKADIFHVECWRSFSPYVFELLSTAARDQSALAAR
jgi:sarcosine oxidase subunit gamma